MLSDNASKITVPLLDILENSLAFAPVNVLNVPEF
jgi:hypothetical protein